MNFSVFVSGLIGLLSICFTFASLTGWLLGDSPANNMIVRTLVGLLAVHILVWFGRKK